MRLVVAACALSLLAACGSEDPEPPPPPPNNTGCNGVTTFHASRGARHIPEGTAISYDENPPSSGNHRAQWATWGEYSAIAPEHWIHNLEHGGAAFLFSTTATVADSTATSALIAYAKNRAPDDGGLFRYISTPHDDLPTAIAVVAWTWTYEANAVCPEEIDSFLTAHYRQSPEDIASNGVFREGWITR